MWRWPRAGGLRTVVRRPRGFVVATLLIVSAVAVASCTGTSGATSTTATTTSTTRAPASTTTEPGEAEIATGIGVDPDTKTITLGVLADLTGPFAALAVDVTDAQQVYWDTVNDAGGLDGWTVDLIVRDTRDDPTAHAEAYDEIRNEVAAISQSTGSATNLAGMSAYIDDDMTVVPLSWYSGWAFPSVDDDRLLEMNTDYCLEAMNIVDFIAGMDGQSIAVATFDDLYGQDAAAGVLAAVDHYGITVPYDGTGAIVPGEELAPVIRSIVDAGADWTFLGTNSSIGAQIIAGAVQLGYEGMFIGPTPAYDSRLLDSASAELYDTRFYQSAYSVAWGEDAPGNVEMMNAMIAAYPDRRPSDAFIVGWNAGRMMHSVLAAAIGRNDLTRAGIRAGARSLDGFDFQGSAPDQTLDGTPNETVVRQSAIYKPDLDLYRSAGGSDQQLSQENATTGSELVEPFFVGEATAGYYFTEPCAGP